MLRRLFAFVVLLALVSAGLYLWSLRHAGGTTLGASARELGSEARGLGAQAKDKLGAMGQSLEDAKIAASVKAVLSLNRNLHPYSIEVTSENGLVTLRGRVEGDALRARAETLAAGVPDVVRVLNQIQAAPGAAPVPGGERTLGESLDERTLQMQVKLALSLNRELQGSDIDVKVDRRVVTLSGEATTRAQGDRALEIARDTSSVGAVVDHIHVRGMTDAGLHESPPKAPGTVERAAAAERALRANSNLAGFDLQVREEGGRLVLRGQLGTHAEKDLAGLLAREGAGGPVENLATVRSGTQ